MTPRNTCSANCLREKTYFTVRRSGHWLAGCHIGYNARSGQVDHTRRAVPNMSAGSGMPLWSIMHCLTGDTVDHSVENWASFADVHSGLWGAFVGPVLQTHYGLSGFQLLVREISNVLLALAWPVAVWTCVARLRLRLNTTDRYEMIDFITHGTQWLTLPCRLGLLYTAKCASIVTS